MLEVDRRARSEVVGPAVVLCRRWHRTQVLEQLLLDERLLRRRRVGAQPYLLLLVVALVQLEVAHHHLVRVLVLLDGACVVRAE